MNRTFSWAGSDRSAAGCGSRKSGPIPSVASSNTDTIVRKIAIVIDVGELIGPSSDRRRRVRALVSALATERSRSSTRSLGGA
jgi:hypothetical protein